MATKKVAKPHSYVYHVGALADGTPLYRWQRLEGGKLRYSPKFTNPDEAIAWGADYGRGLVVVDVDLLSVEVSHVKDVWLEVRLLDKSVHTKRAYTRVMESWAQALAGIPLVEVDKPDAKKALRKFDSADTHNQYRTVLNVFWNDILDAECDRETGLKLHRPQSERPLSRCGLVTFRFSGGARW